MPDLSVLHNFPQWEKLIRDLDDDIYDSKLWDDLITHHEKLVENHTELIRSRKELRTILYNDINKLLTKFPYYIIYWKRYHLIVKTIEGLHASIDILKRAVLICPYSLELWMDYIQLILNTETYKIRDTELKLIFEKASNKIGYFFTSHDFWNTYLDWMASKYGMNSNDYIHVLLKVIKLPLHQYAKFNSKFQHVYKNFAISDLIKDADLQQFINENNYWSKDEGTLEDFIENNSEFLITEYFKVQLEEIKRRSNEKWQYETNLKLDFDLTFIATEEICKWLDYIEYEEDYHRGKGQIDNNPEIINLYERALLPTCLNDKIWIRYNRYLIQNNGPKELIISNFNKACDHFVPIDMKDIRYMYIKYMQLKLKKIDDCKSIFMSLIEKLNTDSEIVSKYIDFLIDLEEIEENKLSLIEDLIKCVHLFNKNNTVVVHTEKKQKVAKKIDESKVAKETDLSIKSEDIVKLSYMLNFWTVGELVVNVCKFHWFKLHNIKKTREIFMLFFNTEAVRSSKAYWFAFFKFELSQRNKKNLKHITDKVKLWSTLSISDVNLIISEYNSFALKNFTLAEMKDNERDIIKNILETDEESSLHMKHFLKVRLAEDNNEDTVNKRLVRENGHPSGSSDGRPTLINPILYSDNLSEIDIKSFPVPKFRNVEKANNNVKFIRESL